MKTESKDYYKDLHRIWWEYLKRSDEYKTFLGILPDYLSTNGPFSSYRKVFEKRWKIKHEIGNTRSIDNVFTIYRRYSIMFGNVFETNFDEWWKGFVDEQHRSVVDLSDDDIMRKLEYFTHLYESTKKQLRSFRPENFFSLLSLDPGYVFVGGTYPHL